MLTVVVVDDEAVIRAGVLEMLTQAKIKAYAAETAEAGLKLARDLKPDIILLDFRLQGLTALQISENFFRINPKQKIIILTGYKDINIAKRLLEKGILGYLIKSCHLSEILKAIKIVSEGKVYVCHDIINGITIHNALGDKSPFSQLSDKELEIVVMLIKHNMDAKAIGKALFLSTKTIHTYRQNIFKKLEVDTDVGVLLKAMEHGLLDFAKK